MPPNGWTIAGYWGGSFDDLVQNYRKDHPALSVTEAQGIVEDLICQRLHADQIFGFCRDENAPNVIVPKSINPVRQGCGACRKKSV